MEAPKAIKTYHAWFQPESNAKMPPSYQVYVSASETLPALYNATVVPRNIDSPVPSDGKQGFWNRCDQTSLDSVSASVNKELIALNGGKEIHHSQERWLERQQQ